MGAFLYLLSWVATGVHVLFGTLALAAALYYLAELVEEYASYAAKVLRCTIIISIILYIFLFLLEEISTSLIAAGIFSHIVHLSILSSFPFFHLSSPPFVLGILMFVVNHYLAFTFFSSYYYPVHEILAYFTLYVWLVPFGFFISLSANENVLPTRAETTPLLSNNQDDFVTGYFSKKSKRYGLLTFLNYIKEEFFPTRSKKSF